MTTTRVAGLLLLLGAAPAALGAQTPSPSTTTAACWCAGRCRSRCRRGASTQRVTLGALDPASLFSLDSTVTIDGLAYDGAVDEGSVLRRSVGRRVVVPPARVEGHGQRAGARRGSAPAPAAGRQRDLQPARRRASIRPTWSWPTRPPRSGSRAPGRRTGSGSATSPSGAAWQASYQVVLGTGDARVTGSAVIESQTLRAEDAEVQLLAGAVGRAQQPQRRRGRYAGRGAWPGDGLWTRSAATEQRVGEFHLYSLPGRTSLLPGLTSTDRAVRAGSGQVRAELRRARPWCRGGASCRSRATRPRRRSR